RMDGRHVLHRLGRRPIRPARLCSPRGEDEQGAMRNNIPTSVFVGIAVLAIAGLGWWILSFFNAPAPGPSPAEAEAMRAYRASSADKSQGPGTTSTDSNASAAQVGEEAARSRSSQ